MQTLCLFFTPHESLKSFTKIEGGVLTTKPKNTNKCVHSSKKFCRDLQVKVAFMG